MNVDRAREGAEDLVSTGTTELTRFFGLIRPLLCPITSLFILTFSHFGRSLLLSCPVLGLTCSIRCFQSVTAQTQLLIVSGSSWVVLSGISTLMSGP